jgi:hypothetical protein
MTIAQAEALAGLMGSQPVRPRARRETDTYTTPSYSHRQSEDKDTYPNSPTPLKPNGDVNGDRRAIHNPDGSYSYDNGYGAIRHSDGSHSYDNGYGAIHNPDGSYSYDNGYGVIRHPNGSHSY